MPMINILTPCDLPSLAFSSKWANGAVPASPPSVGWRVQSKVLRPFGGPAISLFKVKMMLFAIVMLS
ncbi:hypothetical protein PF002_g32600 [Phytophthora fragariae]|uniref:Uncharacterized protein n=1 Tax=Phytophthora fragariae TaxID=53985 RepID=A0A6A3V3N0_9STRA|nr:hypothetical protein PF011_g32128 [Phytophthora fragariae]KAE9160503.1 hypothetical protein PF002_g32600 [Phytophthora fragariae]